jgi:hypothetical protein
MPTHDVDCDVSLVLALPVLQDHLVHPGLFSSRVDHRQVDALSSNISHFYKFIKKIYYHIKILSSQIRMAHCLFVPGHYILDKHNCPSVICL